MSDISKSTPMEEKWRSFLQNHIGAEGSAFDDLAVIQKVFTDMPRRDVNKSNFPRLRITELTSPSEELITSGMDEYDANITLTIFNDMDDNKTIAGNTISVEVLNARIGALLRDVIRNYWKTELYTEPDRFYVNTLSYNRAGIDNEYFDKFNVYKGMVEVNGIYWRIN